MKGFFTLFALFVTVVFAGNSFAIDDFIKQQWPQTDFSKTSINLDEIMSGGPPKDGIPAVDSPIFKPASEISDIGNREPVIAVEINGVDKAYPVRVLIWHEIANDDDVGGVPVAVTYCPLCNAAIVFDRRVDGKVLDFGTSGNLRKSDMVMYDRQTESWWQQFLGQAIVGKMTGTKLKKIPAIIMSFEKFKSAHPDAPVLVPNNNADRPYGSNPYAGYDSLEHPFLYSGKYDGKIPPLAYVVQVGENAWPLENLRKKGKIIYNDITITWENGQNSAMDAGNIKDSKDVGNVSVTRKGKPIVYHVPFAFAFDAFYPNGTVHFE